MDERAHSFGYWLRRRRKALDLTQDALAQRVSCSGFTIRKIEADERRPSRHLAQRLALALAISQDELSDFLDAARAPYATQRLRIAPGPLDGDGPAAAGAVATAGASELAGDTASFVGRNGELALLTGLVARLASGSGCCVLIEGEPGIGKSRLLSELARHAQAQALETLTSNCYEIERAIPYQTVIDLVTRALDRVSDAELHKLAPVSLAELAALVPEVGARCPALPRLSSDYPQARQARLSRAVAQLLETSRANRPAVLMVDDLQWVDDASAQVLHHLARHAARGPVLVVYAYRDEAVDSDEHFAQLMESLRHDADARRLRLARLSGADTEQLVAAFPGLAHGAADLSQRLYRETDGNPFFLVSILQSLSEGETQLETQGGAPGLLPDSLRATVRARLAHLPKALRPLLDMAAVLGRRFDFDTLLHVTGGGETELLEAVETLVKRRVLREDAEAGLFDFCHDKLREVIYRDIGGARCRLLHRKVAEALEQFSQHAPHQFDAQLAEHYERGQHWGKALHYLVLAAERSQKLFAMRDALHWLDRAVALCEAHPQSLDEQQRLALYQQRGAARAQAGQTQGAVADMRRVIEALRADGQRDKTRDALIQLGMAYRRADAYEQASTCLTEALAESLALHDERHAADTLYHLGTVAWSTGRNNQAIGFHQQAVDICERNRLTDLVAVQAYHGRGEAHFANAEPGAAVACYTKSLELARSISDKSYESENLMMIGHACLGSKGLGDYPRAIASFEQALEIARSADLQWHLAPTLLGLDHAHACIGRYGQAWLSMQKTLHWLQGLKQARYQFIAYDCIGHLLLDLDLNEQALDHLEQGIALGNATGIMFWRTAIEAHLAVARSRLGRFDAGPALDVALEQTRGNSERYMGLRCLDALAEIALARGDADACLMHANELLALAAPNDLREMQARARRWRGQAWLVQRRHAQAQAELAIAASLADEIGRVRLQLDTQAALERTHAAQGDDALAQEHAARAGGLASAIEQGLQGSGLKVRLRAA